MLSFARRRIWMATRRSMSSECCRSRVQRYSLSFFIETCGTLQRQLSESESRFLLVRHSVSFRPMGVAYRANRVLEISSGFLELRCLDCCRKKFFDIR